MRQPWSIAVDAALIVVFAIVGRASHHEVLDVAGIAATAWPFVVAGVVASTLCSLLVRRGPYASGAIVWATTVVGGMLLRLLSGSTTAVAFIVVAAVTLGVLLVGWRILAERAARRTSH